MMLEKYTVITTIAVNDLENAEYFYGSVLGLKKTHDYGLGVHYMSGSGVVALYEAPTMGSQGVVAWWVVDSIEQIARKLRRRGIVFEKNDNLPYVKDKDGIYTLGKNHKAAWFRDPDGNVLGIGTK